ncbi:MAG: DUF1573 domain-containing protein [Deltaproteobacteria bacterium]|nr:DUF1573 domain-containing protein [Deltaproteobacteria bacterium]
MFHPTLKDRMYLLGILLVVFCLSVPAFAEPKISVDSLKYEFGEHWEDSQISHTFTVENTGDQELIIEKVRTS